jgi:hypothetical protein
LQEILMVKPQCYLSGKLKTPIPVLLRPFCVPFVWACLTLKMHQRLVAIQTFYLELLCHLQVTYI